MALFVFSLVLITTIALPPQDFNSNEFDTYNANECKRVRRPWLSLTNEEKQDYIDALMQIRENGNGDPLLDELVAIGSAHQDDIGESEHTASSYLFWHGYLLWELESRIRNLGGKYSCFGMPYWDFSTEANRPEGTQPYIYGDILGGNGNSDDYYTVNGYSWDYTTQQYWVPAHCDAEGDEYPLCSLKRTFDQSTGYSAQKLGDGISQNTEFKDFTVWYATTLNLPRQTLTGVDYLCEPVITSYDPMWYLFHSMVSYHQAIWTDCNDYDKIAPKDLDLHPEAYSAFCYSHDIGDDSSSCPPLRLDDKQPFGGALPDMEWSFVHSNELTVRNSYHFPRWNIIYDLEDGSGFYTESGLKEFCKGKLNPQWFILNENVDESGKEKVFENEKDSLSVVSVLSYNRLMIAIFVMMFVGVGMWCVWKNKNESEKLWMRNADNYGSF